MDNTMSQPLKYLFTAFYSDGSSYQQAPEDKSLLHEKGSAFSDVDQDKLVAFCLEDQTNKPLDGTVYTVNLLNGIFAINEHPFFMHEEEITNIRLIFFRKHIETLVISGDSEPAHTSEIYYRLGWQALDKEGKNIRRVMVIK
jgi:hypothetical protein